MNKYDHFWTTLDAYVGLSLGVPVVFRAGLGEKTIIRNKSPYEYKSTSESTLISEWLIELRFLNKCPSFLSAEETHQNPTAYVQHTQHAHH